MTKKKMTLDKSWQNCMAMWRWIGTQIKAKTKNSVTELKEQWVFDHCSGSRLQCNCFFCEYAKQNGEIFFSGKCKECPGTKIDKNFDCMHKHYSFDLEPIRFLTKLESLYAQYMKTLPKKKSVKPKKKVQQSLVSLLRWAQRNKAFITIFGNGVTEVCLGKNPEYTYSESTLYRALVSAKSQWSKDKNL